MAGRDDEFDWIDGAFDDKRSQERFGNASDMKAAGCAIVAVAIIVTAVVCIAIFSGIVTATLASQR